MIGLGFLILILLGVTFAIACSSTPEEKIRKAEEELKQVVVEEKRGPIYDNGKNFFWIEDPGWAKAMVVLQEWVDAHPCEEFVTMSAGGHSEASGGNEGWMVHYRDVPNCSLTETK